MGRKTNDMPCKGQKVTFVHCSLKSLVLCIEDNKEDLIDNLIDMLIDRKLAVN